MSPAKEARFQGQEGKQERIRGIRFPRSRHPPQSDVSYSTYGDQDDEDDLDTELYDFHERQGRGDRPNTRVPAYPPKLKHTSERITIDTYARWRTSWYIWKSERPCEDHLIARRTYAVLEHDDAYNAVKHLKIEDKLDTADYRSIISTLDDAFGYYEEEEKYIAFDKIFCDNVPTHDNMRALCLDYKGRWANLEREIGSGVPEELKGYLLLKQSGLSEKQLRDVVLALDGDWKINSIEKKLRQLYDNQIIPKIAAQRSKHYGRHQEDRKHPSSRRHHSESRSDRRYFGRHDKRHQSKGKGRHGRNRAYEVHSGSSMEEDSDSESSDSSSSSVSSEEEPEDEKAMATQQRGSADAFRRRKEQDRERKRERGYRREVPHGQDEEAKRARE